MSAHFNFELTRVQRLDIRIRFGDLKKLPKSDELRVLLDDLDLITVANPGKVDSLTRLWTLDDEMHVSYHLPVNFALIF